MDIVSSVASGLRWTFLGKLIRQLFSWISTFIVIRILSPEDYGLVAISSAIVSFGMLVSELGLSAAIVHSEKVSHKRLRQAFTINSLVCLLLYALVAFAANWVADIYDNALLSQVVPIQGLQLVLSIFIVIPAALTSRKLQFKVRSMIEMVTGLSSTVLTLLLALAGFGIWSLVFGTLLSHTFRGVIYNFYYRSVYFPTIDFSGFLEFGRYSSFNFLNRLLFYLCVQIDVFLIGKLLSVQVLGIYSVANNLATLPLSKIGLMVNEVGLAAFSRIKSDKNAMTYYFLSATSVMAVASFPIFFGISAVSENLVLTILGDKWSEVSFPITILALVIPLRALLLVVNLALDGLGLPEIGTKNLATCLVLILIAVIGGSGFGINGVCIALVIAYVLHFIFSLIRILPVLDVSFRNYLSAIVRSAGAAFCMLIVVHMFGIYFQGYESAYILLGQLILGACVYTGMLILILPDSQLNMIRRFLFKKKLNTESPDDSQVGEEL